MTDSSSSLEDLWPHFHLTDNLAIHPPAPQTNRTVVHIDAYGRAMMIEFHKHRIVRDLNVRYRDAMMLDPSIPTPFPSSILIRDRAMIVNIEAVRMIICANQCYLLSVPKVGDPGFGVTPTLTNPFVKELCQCLAHINDPVHHGDSRGLKPSRSGGKSTGIPNITGREFDPDAPYELRVLEVAFRVVLQALMVESHILEETGYPALANMARAVTETSLRQVRDLKKNAAELTKRVQTLRMEVDKILKSDHDMADMYLARRAIQRGLSLPPQPIEVRERAATAKARASGALTSPGKIASLEEEEFKEFPAKIEDLPEISQRAMRYSASAVVHTLRIGQAWKRHALGKLSDSDSATTDLSGLLDGNISSSTGEEVKKPAQSEEKVVRRLETDIVKAERQGILPSEVDPHQIEAAEDMLESAFLNLDHVLRSLTLLGEQIGHDELLVRIAMDSRRNALVQLELWVSNVTMGFSFVAMIAGIFGMNLINTAWLENSAGFFWFVIIMSTIGLIVLPLAVIAYMRRRRLNLTFDVAL